MQLEKAIRSVMLKAKLRLPMGVTLTNSEAKSVIGDWKSQVVAQESAADNMLEVSEQTERQLARIKQWKKEAAQTFDEATKNFKKYKTPVKKEIWARRLVLSNQYHEELLKSEKRLTSSVEQVKASVADARIVANMLRVRIEEAQIYRQLNGGLKLVGQALVDARKDYNIGIAEHTNLEFNMEALEKEVMSKTRSTVLLEAEAVVKKRSK